MKALCLFEGIGSSKKVLESLGFDVVCVEIEEKYNPTIVSDIMKWNYKKDYNPNEFDIITASPVCLYWSKLRNTWIGRKCKKIHPTDVITKDHILNDINKYGKPMVDRTLEIIDYFKPTYWWIENPSSSTMWKYIEQKYSHLNYKSYTFDYCKYSDYGYKKPTTFITNYDGVKTMRCKNDCDNIITIPTQLGAKHSGYGTPIKGKTRTLHKSPIGDDKKATIKVQHKTVLGNGYEMINGKKVLCNTKEKRDELRLHKANFGSKKNDGVNIKCVGGGSSREERYRIPPLLIEELIKPMFGWN